MLNYKVHTKLIVFTKHKHWSTSINVYDRNGSNDVVSGLTDA